jgi:hypothetical protein
MLDTCFRLRLQAINGERRETRPGEQPVRSDLIAVWITKLFCTCVQPCQPVSGGFGRARVAELTRGYA